MALKPLPMVGAFITTQVSAKTTQDRSAGSGTIRVEKLSIDRYLSPATHLRQYPRDQLQTFDRDVDAWSEAIEDFFPKLKRGGSCS